MTLRQWNVGCLAPDHGCTANTQNSCRANPPCSITSAIPLLSRILFKDFSDTIELSDFLHPSNMDYVTWLAMCLYHYITVLGHPSNDNKDVINIPDSTITLQFWGILPTYVF